MPDSDEGWKELCVKIQLEKDPHELMRLVEELNRILEQRERRLGNRSLDQKAGS